jgi:hypothetical protein
MDKESLLQLAKTIENKAFDKMWTLEGKDPETERNNSKKKGSQNSLKATYMAVGKRVRVYKQKLVEHKGVRKADTAQRLFQNLCSSQIIIERPEDLEWIA